MKQNINRREALRRLAWAALAVTPFSGCALRSLKEADFGLDPSAEPLSSPADLRSPIARTSLSRGIFSGDDPHRAHRALWDKAGYLQERGGAWPAPTEETELLIAGGGVSGLLSAYLLRDHQTVVLEQAARFGGNAKGASWQGIDFSLGAAYISAPEPGSAMAALLAELGLKGTVAPDEKTVLWRGKLEELWRASEPAAQAQAIRAEKLFQQILEGAYPVIPPQTAAEHRLVKQYDRESFHDFLTRNLGPLAPKLAQFFEHYSASAMGAPAREVSAAVGVSFFAGEFAPLLTFPGGNSAITEAIYQKVKNTAELKTSSLLVNVVQNARGLLATYEDENGALKTIRARAMVMACPKFVAAKVTEGLSAQRQEAFGSIRSYGYVVANVFLRRPAPEFYDLFLLGKPGVTDLVNANYANPAANPALHSVLTLYRPLPYAGARAELLAEKSYEKFASEIRAQLTEEIFPALGIETAVEEVHLSRWGHAIPVAPRGFFRREQPSLVRAPLGKIFFVEQDNWACPSLEACASEAMHFAPAIRLALGSKPKT